MLLNEIDALTERVHKLKEMEKALGECDRFETRAYQLDQLAEMLRASVAAVELLKNSGIDVPVNVSVGQLLGTNAQMRESLETEGSSAVSDTSGFGQRFKRPLEGVCSGATSAAADAWRRYVDATWPQVNKEMMHVLKRVKGFAESVSKVLTLDQTRQSFLARVPSCEEHISQYREAVKALEDAQRSLGSDYLPDHIVGFMRDAGIDGLPLDKLTTETLDWLKEQGLLSQFVVRTA